MVDKYYTDIIDSVDMSNDEFIVFNLIKLGEYKFSKKYCSEELKSLKKGDRIYVVTSEKGIWQIYPIQSLRIIKLDSTNYNPWVKLEKLGLCSVFRSAIEKCKEGDLVDVVSMLGGRIIKILGKTLIEEKATEGDIKNKEPSCDDR